MTGVFGVESELKKDRCDIAPRGKEGCDKPVQPPRSGGDRNSEQLGRNRDGDLGSLSRQRIKYDEGGSHLIKTDEKAREIVTA